MKTVISVLLLFHLNSVWLPSAHVEFMVAHTEGEDSLVDPQSWGEEHKVRRFLVNWLRKGKILKHLHYQILTQTHMYAAYVSYRISCYIPVHK